VSYDATTAQPVPSHTQSVQLTAFSMAWQPPLRAENPRFGRT